MSIDAVKYHHGNGAETEEDAGWHMAVFLSWCASRGLLAPEHSAEEVQRDAQNFLMYRCGGKLWDSDLSPAGALFAAAAYEQYLTEVSDLAVSHDLGPYELRVADDDGRFRAALWEYLDVRLAGTTRS